MGHRKRRYINRVYIPRRRGLLGPRHLLKAAEAARPFDYAGVSARWLYDSNARIETVSQAMPRGGVRWMARCPLCLRLRRALYLTPYLKCRVCAGKYYATRDGYRPRSRLTKRDERRWERRHDLAFELAQSKLLLRSNRQMMRWYAYTSELIARHEREQTATDTNKRGKNKSSYRRLLADLKRQQAECEQQEAEVRKVIQKQERALRRAA